MSSVNISIAQDVYDFLTEIKKTNDKSYSQIIRDLKNKAGYEKGTLRDIQKIYGVAKNINETQMKQFREEVEHRL